VIVARRWRHPFFVAFLLILYATIAITYWYVTVPVAAVLVLLALRVRHNRRGHSRSW
jgi:hypothetical protein